MLKPNLHITTNSEVNLPAELEEYLWELYKPRIDMMIEQKLGVNSGIYIEEYQMIEWFTEKYRISKKTFHKYKKLGYVDSKQVGRHKMYKVKQWVNNLNKTQSVKPAFLEKPLRKVN